MKKFFSDLKNNQNNSSDWYYECHDRQIPFITVLTNKNLADIQFDYFTYDSVHDNFWEFIDDDMMSLLTHLLNIYGGKDSSFTTNQTIINLSGVSIENKDIVATILFDYIHRMMTEFKTKEVILEDIS